MSKQYIAIVTGHYPPPFTANAVRAYYMVRSLRKHGYGVVVVPLLSSWQGRRAGFFGEEVISLFTSVKSELERPSLIRRISDIFSKQKRVNEIIRALSSYSVSAVIGTLPPVEAIPIASRVADELSIPVITDIQDLADDYRIMERPYLYPVIRQYFKRVYSAVAEADLVSTTTEYMAEVIRERTKNSNVIVVPNGVDVEHYAKCFEIRKCSQSQEPIAVFLGDLNWRYHKLDSFIRALGLLRDEGVMVHLKVIGTGKLLPKLRKLASELKLENQVRFYGYLEFEDLTREMGASAFAVAGRPAMNNAWIRTSMRLTIYEYLACGLPILAYGPPNSYTEHFIITHSVGIYIPSDDPSRIAKELVLNMEGLLSKDPAEIRALSLKYDWGTVMEVFVNSVERVMQDLMSRAQAT